MDARYCKFCDNTHPLTPEFWYRLGSSPRCKLQVREKARVWHHSNKEAVKKRAKVYKENNRVNLQELNRIWRENNREHHNSVSREWYYKNRERILQYRKGYHSKREKTDVNFKLARRLRSRLYHALTGKNKVVSAVKDMGCTLDFLKNYLESQFTKEMTWANYGSYWEIDHHFPLSKFDLTVREQQLRAVHYSNLRPLPITFNRAKRDKVPQDGDILSVSGNIGERCDANTEITEELKNLQYRNA
jgi:hypothetical protein